MDGHGSLVSWCQNHSFSGPQFPYLCVEIAVGLSLKCKSPPAGCEVCVPDKMCGFKDPCKPCSGFYPSGVIEIQLD